MVSSPPIIRIILFHVLLGSWIHRVKLRCSSCTLKDSRIYSLARTCDISATFAFNRIQPCNLNLVSVRPEWIPLSVHSSKILFTIDPVSLSWSRDNPLLRYHILYFGCILYVFPPVITSILRIIIIDVSFFFIVSSHHNFILVNRDKILSNGMVWICSSLIFPFSTSTVFPHFPFAFHQGPFSYFH